MLAHSPICPEYSQGILNCRYQHGKSVKVTKDVTGFGDVEVSDIQTHINLKFSNADNVDIDNSRFPSS